MRIPIPLLAAILLSSLPALAADPPKEAKPTASVLDPTGKGVSKDDLELLGEAIRDGVVSVGRFRVQDRAAMKEILSQQQLNASELCDESCAVEQGRMLQVRFLVSSTVRRADDTTWISVRMTDVESGEVVGTARDSCPRCGATQMVGLAERLTRQVITGEKAAQAVAPVASSPPPPPPPPAAGPRTEPSVKVGGQPNLLPRVEVAGLRASASAGLAVGFSGFAGAMLEVGVGQWSGRVTLGFPAAGVAGRWSLDDDGGRLFIEGGASTYYIDPLVGVLIYSLVGGWRWQMDMGLFFQAGAGGFLDDADFESTPWPAVDLEVGFKFL